MNKYISGFLMLIIVIGICLYGFWSIFGGRLRSNGNEEIAYMSLSEIVTGAYSFYKDTGRYPKDIGELALASEKKSLTGFWYIPKDLYSGVYRNYKFEIIDSGDSSEFFAIASPVAKENVWSFCVTHDSSSGKPTSENSPIRYNAEGKRINSIDDCLKQKSVGYTYP